MKLWVDDVRPAPQGYVWIKSVFEARKAILENDLVIEVIDLDHDAGDYAQYGGDYINVLKFIEELGIDYIPIHIHSMNPVGVENMRRIIRHNGWKEV